jgi:hypothetical protein
MNVFLPLSWCYRSYNNAASIINVTQCQIKDGNTFLSEKSIEIRKQPRHIFVRTHIMLKLEGCCYWE